MSSKTTRTWAEAMANKEEIFPAKEIFELIQFNARGKFEQSLVDELLKTNALEDIRMAMELGSCIATIHEFAFGDQLPIQFWTTGTPFAKYLPSYEDLGEQYAVIVPECERAMEEHIAKARVKLVDTQGKAVKPSPPLFKELFLLQVAVHEVRHRAQHLPRFTLFTADHEAVADKHLAKVIGFYTSFFKARQAKLQSQGIDEKVIAKKTGPKEFDALVIDCLAQAKIYQGVTLQQLVDMVLLQPD